MNPICPYCSAPIEPDPERRRYCHACGTAHHAECWDENGGCTVFGCTAAPPDEPKITVSAAEFASAAPPPPPPLATGVAPPPPPPPARPAPFLSLGGYATPLPAPIPGFVPGIAVKSRSTYVVLGVFLGAFGAHNFYAGYTGRAVAQLCITLLTLFFGAIISWIWAIVEICTVERDSQNNYML